MLLLVLQTDTASTLGSAEGTGKSASASQGLTAVTTTANNTSGSSIIHNSAATGSSAAELNSSSGAKSQTGPSMDRQSNSTTGGSVTATGKAANAASDSSEVSTAVAPGTVRLPKPS